MEDRYIEIEPYEEIVDRDEVFSTPSGSRSASPVSVDGSLPSAQSLSQGPSTSVYNANLMTSVMRPDPRYELALASQVPHTQSDRAPRHVGGGSHSYGVFGGCGVFSGTEVTQIVVPKHLRAKILQLAHDIPAAAHLERLRNVLCNILLAVDAF